MVDVFERVRSEYVEKPDDTMLVESAINGMLAALDPHSSYLSPRAIATCRCRRAANSAVFGIEVTMENGVIKVVSPIDETPAAKAGILANDLITHLDNEQITGLTLEQAVEKMRGPVNTPITLTVVRKGKDEPFDIKIVRDVIRINPVKARAENDVAYIKVSTFNEQTHQNLVKAIDSLKKEIGTNLKGYIIDLRNNPGGLLDQAIAVSDDFLEQGAIVLNKGRNNEETQRLRARPGDVTEGKPVLVLINGGSASASEIDAGPFRTTSARPSSARARYGKGSVQTIIPSVPTARSASRRRAILALQPLDPGKGHRSRYPSWQELPEELKSKLAAEKPRARRASAVHGQQGQPEGRRSSQRK